MNEYTSTVTISWGGNNHEANNTFDYMTKVIAQFKEQFGINLAFSDIQDITLLNCKHDTIVYTTLGDGTFSFDKETGTYGGDKIVYEDKYVCANKQCEKEFPNIDTAFRERTEGDN